MKKGKDHLRTYKNINDVLTMPHMRHVLYVYISLKIGGGNYR